MYKDIISPNEEGDIYYTSTFQKPVYMCDPCSLKLTTVWNDYDETKPCPICGELMKKELVSMTFTQDQKYTTISC